MVPLPDTVLAARYDNWTSDGRALVFSAVPAGIYDLVALPLRIEGADGSPVRAVLVERAS